MARWLLAVAIGGLVGAIAAFVAPGFLLEGPLEPLTTSDVIVVISGDEALARYRDGIRLYRAGWAPRLLFSGATWDGTRLVGNDASGLATRANSNRIKNRRVGIDGVPETTDFHVRPGELVPYAEMVQTGHRAPAAQRGKTAHVKAGKAGVMPR